MIICITGLAGAGKTTFANLLATKLKQLGHRVLQLNTDQVREQLYQGEISDYKADFSDEELKRTYNGLYFTVSAALQANPNCIVIADGSFRKTSQRLLLEIVAEKLHTPFQLIKLETPVSLAQQRLVARQEQVKLGGWIAPNAYEEVRQLDAIRINNKGSVLELNRAVITVVQQLGLSVIIN